jgi:glycerophosphoryl diester phosphodiesterase
MTVNIINNTMDFKIISHRGKIENSKYQENTLDALKECLDMGFSIEIDVMKKDEKIYLGHDSPDTEVDISEIDFDGVYIHMKSPHIINLKNADLFFIENDSYALTKKNKIWTNYNNKEYNQDSIMCSAELVGGSFNMDEISYWAKKAHGVCTDFPLTVYNNLK